MHPHRHSLLHSLSSPPPPALSYTFMCDGFVGFARGFCGWLLVSGLKSRPAKESAHVSTKRQNFVLLLLLLLSSCIASHEATRPSKSSAPASLHTCSRGSNLVVKFKSMSLSSFRQSRLIPAPIPAPGISRRMLISSQPNGTWLMPQIGDPLMCVHRRRFSK